MKMYNKKIVIISDKELAKYGEKIAAQLKDHGIDCENWSLFKDYRKNEAMLEAYMQKLSVQGKFLFIGDEKFIGPLSEIISEWKFDHYRCRIGWNGNYGVITANQRDFGLKYLAQFADYCKARAIKHDDILIPKAHGKILEDVKGFFDAKSNIRQSQYSVLIWEFIDNWSEKFLNDTVLAVDVEKEKQSITELLREYTDEAESRISKERFKKCHAIIQPASLVCAGAAFIPIPFVDLGPITVVQVSMVLGIAKVFGKKISRNEADTIIKRAAAPFGGRALGQVARPFVGRALGQVAQHGAQNGVRALAKNALIFLPGVGWVVNAAIAALITEMLGWKVVNDFALKANE
jgi:uncharacterized protein (DUF697 family)